MLVCGLRALSLHTSWCIVGSFPCPGDVCNTKHRGPYSTGSDSPRLNPAPAEIDPGACFLLQGDVQPSVHLILPSRVPDSLLPRPWVKWTQEQREEGRGPCAQLPASIVPAPMAHAAMRLAAPTRSRSHAIGRSRRNGVRRCSNVAVRAGALVEVTDDTWDEEVMQANKPVLVDFW